MKCISVTSIEGCATDNRCGILRGHLHGDRCVSALSVSFCHLTHLAHQFPLLSLSDCSLVNLQLNTSWRFLSLRMLLMCRCVATHLTAQEGLSKTLLPRTWSNSFFALSIYLCWRIFYCSCAGASRNRRQQKRAIRSGLFLCAHQSKPAFVVMYSC